MRKTVIALAFAAISFASCNQKTVTTEEITNEVEQQAETAKTEEVAKDTTVFAERALKQEFVGLDGKFINLEQILAQYKDKVVLIDVWAAWCPDCIKAVPTMQEIKKEFTSVVFLNLSLDKTQDSWKEAIKKHEIEGEHYFSMEGKGMKGDFGKALDLNWIPRYIVVGKDGKIALYNATEKNFEEIKELLNKIQ